MPFTNPFPGARSVLIMDNCRIHHGEDVRHLVEDDHRKFPQQICNVSLTFL